MGGRKGEKQTHVKGDIMERNMENCKSDMLGSEVKMNKNRQIWKITELWKEEKGTQTNVNGTKYGRLQVWDVAKWSKNGKVSLNLKEWGQKNGGRIKLGFKTWEMETTRREIMKKNYRAIERIWRSRRRKFCLRNCIRKDKADNERKRSRKRWTSRELIEV